MTEDFHRILDAAGDLILVLDNKGRLSYVNGAVQRILGYTAETLQGRALREITAPSARETLDSAIERITQHLTDSVLLALPLLRQGEGDIWVELRLTPLQDSVGQINQVVGVVRDINERIKAEAELQRRLEELATLRRIDVELTQQLEIDYVLAMALDAVVRLTAADAGVIEVMRDGSLYKGTIVGPYSSEFVQDYPKEPRGIVARCLARRQPELVLDVSQDPDYVSHIAQTRAQMTVPLISHDLPIGVLFLETHNPSRFTSSIFDLIQSIAARIAAAVDNAQLHDTLRQNLAELQDLYEQISNLEQLKTDMIRIAAHDMGSPLTAIMGGIDMLGDTPLNERQVVYSDMVRSAAEQIHKIIRDILSLQRIEELAQGSYDSEVDMVDLVQQVSESQRPYADRSGQHYALTLSDVPTIVRGDAAQLREAIINLIGNAIKYTPAEGVIDVSLRRENGSCIFRVQDSGVGIPDDQQERLFQPFYRAKVPEVKGVQGTGLGLHLVKNIIERHGGTMRFKSIYGEGSCFGFSLPVKED